MTHQDAIEAVHAAICEESLADHLGPNWRGRCVKAVEAAAPYLRARALTEAAEDINAEPCDRNYSPDECATCRAAETLRARAVAERGEG